MKRFILFFTLIFTLINTQLLSYGDIYNISGNTVHGPDGIYQKSGNTIYTPNGIYTKCGNTVYGPDGTYTKCGNTVYGPNGTYTKCGNTVYGPNGTYTKCGNTVYAPNGIYQKCGNTIYGPNKQNNQNINNYNKNDEKEDKNKLSYCPNKSKIKKPRIISDNGHLLIDKNDMKNSYKEEIFVMNDGSKFKRSIEVKINKKKNGYEMIIIDTDKFSIYRITNKEYYTLVPYNKDQYKITKKATPFFFFKSTYYEDKT